MSYKIPSKVLTIVACLLFCAAAPLPYGYYTFVKIVVFICAGLMSCDGFRIQQRGVWPWLWSAIAIIFNPFVPIHMVKEFWMILDILTGAVFSFVAFHTFCREKERSGA